LPSRNVFQFSVRDLMLGTTIVCVVLSLTIWLGDVAGPLFLFFVGTFMVSALLPNRALTILTLVAFTMSALPWLDASGYVFVYPGSEEPLPTLRLTETRVILRFVDVLYTIGELPLHLATYSALYYHQYIYFSGSECVRPFAFFVFWAGLAIVFGAARWTGRRRQRKARDQARSS